VDTFLDMRGWGKGVVLVNGRNVGRYWRIGPQQTLYLPASWMKRGRNEVIVVDLLEGGRRSVAGVGNPVYETVG
jgi:beta-galactosidase